MTTMPFPTFLILGAMRCGTSALHSTLADHPQVFMSRKKEPNFFHDLHYRKSAFNDYQKVFDGWNGQQVVGESSVLNLYYRFTAELIQKVLPNAQLIIVLRRPVDRAYSHYCYCVKKGHEWETFPQAIRSEVAKKRLSHRFSSKGDWVFSYRSLSTYGPQLARYFDRFHREQILIISYESLIANPTCELRRIAEFLRIDPTVPLSLPMRTEPVANAGQWPRNRLLHRCAVRVAWESHAHWRLRSLARKALKTWPMETNLPSVPSEAVGMLEPWFEADLMWIRGLLGPQFTWPKKDPS